MTPDSEQLLARALADYIDQQANADTVDIPTFCGRYPRVAPELRRQIEALDEIERMTEGPRALPEDLPARLSGHKILSEIGSGGMGRVFLAVDEGLGRKVAIKTLNRRYLQDPALRARFMREARSMARLSHPNIVRIYNLGASDEQPHFVMEYVEGVPLTQAARPLTFEQKADAMRKIALAVQFLHDNQLLHRDLKPGNILVGSDLEPKLLDFGLALQVDDHDGRLTLAGEVMGTPNYFSPEHAAPQEQWTLAATSFPWAQSFTKSSPVAFRSGGTRSSGRSALFVNRSPRSHGAFVLDLPGDLQNICLKALEKDPRNRYQSAREMAADLDRFLAGVAVFAAPAAYSRLMAGKIPQHLAELQAWKSDHLLSDHEFESFRKSYDRLVEREDAWIMEVRRISLSQVSLYLGAWVLVVAAAMVVLFRYTHLTGTPAVLLVFTAPTLTVWNGIRSWNRGQLRIAVAYLLAFCLLLPVAMQVAMGEYGLASSYTRGQQALELFAKSTVFKGATNAQLWWSLLLSLPAYYWLRRYTRSHVFSLVLAVIAALFCLATLLRMGLMEWLDTPGKVYFYLIPCAIVFFAVGMAIERFKKPNDARYFYPLAVAFTLVALSGVAAQYQVYADWLKDHAAWTHGRVEYLFILNAGIYFALLRGFEGFPFPQLRSAVKAFRFVIPGHVMTSLLLLDLAATNEHLIPEAHIFQILLPAIACGFVFLSIPRQMKNFFVSGLLFLAIGLVRLQQDLFKDRAAWPIILLVAGLALMLAAANYAHLKMGARRLFRR